MFFDIASISIGVILLLLRVAVVFLLYFFLWQVIQVIKRDLSQTSPVTAPASPYGQLVVTRSGQSGVAVGKVFPLNPITVIGRNPNCDIVLNDSFLSSEHARLERRNGVWWLEDLNSTNGTFLNGFEVRGPTEVHPGDAIQVGRVELRLE
ncbi:MAG: FHA domain-containing protein [Chloroflexus sp.]|jgi:pSer/pThr/pTyr-binding forkhead associated (FHA) protein|nr:FHA domain-containing protein [Chloroflexus sp.]MBO9372251.1 FHA domain-containing protein [Chloroflexus sp.]